MNYALDKLSEDCTIDRYSITICSYACGVGVSNNKRECEREEGSIRDDQSLSTLTFTFLFYFAVCFVYCSACGQLARGHCSKQQLYVNIIVFDMHCC